MLGKKYRDFGEYMQQNYRNEISQSVERFAFSNRDKLDLKSGHIYKVIYLRVGDIRVAGVTFKEAGDGLLEIRVSVDAEVKAIGDTRYGKNPVSTHLWSCVFFHAFLEDGLHDVKVFKVTGYEGNKYERDRSLSQDLVPYMHEEDIEEHAEDFLKRNYPEALLQTMPVPAEAVAVGMGMEIYYAPMEDGIFGKTYFAGEKVQVYDSIFQKETEEIMTRPGTMLINPNVYFMYNVGTVNNTIIHECVHWDRHRRAFELQKLLNGGCDNISCAVVEKYEGIPEGAQALQWMEWQANQLAPRILMPQEATRKVFDDTLAALHKEDPSKRYAEIVEEAVGRTATYFSVSYTATKLRLIELGYDYVEGAKVFCNGKYMPPFTFTEGSLGKKQTYVIDEQSAVSVIYKDMTLRKLFFEDKIVYADCMVCLNTPKYIRSNENGIPALTEYALEHVDECCFIFDREISASSKYSDTFYRKCFLCKNTASGTTFGTTFKAQSKANREKEERGKEIARFKEISKNVAEVMDELPQGFGRTLKYHIEHSELNASELSEKSHISKQTISKYINQGNAKKKYQNVVAIGKALELDPILMENLLEKAGYGREYDEVSIFIKFLIWHHPNDSLEDWQKKIDDAEIDLKLPG